MKVERKDGRKEGWVRVLFVFLILAFLIKTSRGEELSPKEKEYVLMCENGLEVNGEVKANGPLANVYSGKDVIVRGNLIITGDLAIKGNFTNLGKIDITGEVISLPSSITIPSVDFDLFKAKANYLFTDEGSVYEYDDNHNLIRKISGGIYTDPSGAKWRFHSRGKKGFWQIQGETPSSLKGIVYFTTDLKLPDHILNINGTLVVEGSISDSGQLYVKTKPDEWALLCRGDLFLRNKSDIWGKVWVGGNLKLPDTAGEEPIPIAKYHVKGKVYVLGNCFVNGRFHINHLEVVQKIEEVILIAEEDIEELKWTDTHLIGDYEEGSPGIAIIEFENPFGEKLSVITGDAEYYGTDLMYGLSYSTILESMQKAEDELGLKFERIAYIPPIYFVGILCDGSGVILYPRSSIKRWTILTQSELQEAYNKIKEYRLDPEGIQARKEEWEFFTKKYYEYFSPHSPGWCDGNDNWTSVYKTSNKDMFTKNDWETYTEKEPFPGAWANWTQDDADASCAPTASTQIFMYERDVMNHRCITGNNKEITVELAKAMGTGWKENGYWGDTNPWDIDEGIENVASKYGYSTESNWTGLEVTSSGLWHRYFDYIDEYKIPQIFCIGGWASPWGDHCMTVVGALRRWWDWWCFSLAKHWIYFFNNWAEEKGDLQRYRIDNDAHGVESLSMVWEGVTVEAFTSKSGFWYPDKDGDGYGSLWIYPKFEIIDRCPSESVPSGYSPNGNDCDDTNAQIYPGAPELCDGKDNNCDGQVPAEEKDEDGDGYRVCQGDCLDLSFGGELGKWSKNTHPGASEGCEIMESSDINLLNAACEAAKIWWPDRECLITDGIVSTLYIGGFDHDCDGKAEIFYYMDVDGDGYGAGYPYCLEPPQAEGWAGKDGDCDEKSSYINPGQQEVCGNCIDENCNGQMDETPCTLYELCENGVDDDKDGVIDEGYPNCVPYCCEGACKANGWCSVVKGMGNNAILTNLLFLLITLFYALFIRWEKRK